MTNNQDIIIDPSKKSSLRVGLSWDGLERDHQKFFMGQFSAVKAPFLMLGTAIDIVVAHFQNNPEDKEAEMNKIKRQSQIYREDMPPHDLDLLCFCFDVQKKLHSFVAPIYGQEIDVVGSVMHSGDDPDGVGIWDDEDVRVLFAKIPPEVQSIFFVVDSDTHNFATVPQDRVRAVDTSIEKDYFCHDLADGVEDVGSDKKTFIFASLTRKDEKWALRNISKYIAVDSDPQCRLDDSISEIITNNYL